MSRINISAVFACSVLIISSAFSQSATAVPITDTVIVGDKEWAQVVLFTSLSWNDMNAVCPAGVCGVGTLNGFDMDGWTWASRADVGDDVDWLDAAIANGGLLSRLGVKVEMLQRTELQVLIVDFRDLLEKNLAVLFQKLFSAIGIQ